MPLPPWPPALPCERENKMLVRLLRLGVGGGGGELEDSKGSLLFWFAWALDTQATLELDP